MTPKGSHKNVQTCPGDPLEGALATQGVQRHPKAPKITITRPCHHLREAPEPSEQTKFILLGLEMNRTMKGHRIPESSPRAAREQKQTLQIICVFFGQSGSLPSKTHAGAMRHARSPNQTHTKKMPKRNARKTM